MLQLLEPDWNSIHHCKHFFAIINFCRFPLASFPCSNSKASTSDCRLNSSIAQHIFNKKGKQSCYFCLPWNNWEMKLRGKTWYKRFFHCNFIFSQLHLQAKRIKNFPQIYFVKLKRKEMELDMNFHLFSFLWVQCGWFEVGHKEKKERGRQNDNEIMIFFPCIFRAINFSPASRFAMWVE